MKFVKESKTSFKRNKAGKVTKVVRSGYQNSIDAKLVEYEKKQRAERKKKSAKKWAARKKKLKKFQKEMNSFGKSLDDANRWLTGKK